MNLIGKSNNELLFINFNQDFSCIAVGNKTGYKIYNCDPFGKCHNEGGIGIVEMLFNTSLVALVGAGDKPAFSPRKLQINNTKRESTICELTFPNSILSVKLNRKRMIVVLKEQIYCYDISNMKLLHIIETGKNSKAICALSPSNENGYLAYPAPTPSEDSPFSNQSSNSNTNGTSTGDIIIFDTLSLSVVNIIHAHKSSISYMCINPEGTMLATASDKGTVIRVFSLPSGQKLFQFRRGSYNAKIYSISFNMVSSLLCVSSDTDTVHIFRLSNTSKSNNGTSIQESESGSNPLNRRTSFHSMVGKRLANSMGNYLPEAFTEIWEPSRDFAFLKLPNVGVHSIVALSSTTPQVMVITSEGYLYQYNIDLENGGECVLLKQYSLLESSDTLANGLLIN
ncbi:WD40 repeat-like protein [Neoconidiobolus thromboides FSU 785]|nr:WD40 repeat-like protein [Neoconidiobolus thromboides FSU 785]